MAHWLNLFHKLLIILGGLTFGIMLTLIFAFVIVTIEDTVSKFKAWRKSRACKAVRMPLHFDRKA
jgi:hypothetical protein